MRQERWEIHVPGRGDPSDGRERNQENLLDGTCYGE